MESIDIPRSSVIKSGGSWKSNNTLGLNCHTSPSHSSDDDFNPPMKQKPVFVKKHRSNLPSESVKVLKQWLFEHRFQPYPNDLEKNVLAGETRLSNIQICNWFVNARRRILPDMLRQDGLSHEQVIIRRRGRRMKSRSSNESTESVESNDDCNETVGSPVTGENQLELIETSCEIDGTCDYPEYCETLPLHQNNQEIVPCGDFTGSLHILLAAAMVIHRNEEIQARNQ